MAKSSGKKPGKQVEALRHKDDKRRNIPTAEHQSVIEKTEEAPKEVRYARNTDLDPQLMWRGKDYQDWSDLVVQAPPLYIQEKIQPKALIDDLVRQTHSSDAQKSESQFDLFSDFNGIPEGADKTEFYRHDQNWSNRMILGDSLQVMASLAEREGLRGKVQCIYFDPPYGIRFNSNFQWSTTSNRVLDGRADQITREPEQVKAFRDTWRDGIHSYLGYLRDRLGVARDLLAESGSIFVQIGDENVHRVRMLLDEVFGAENFCAQISYRTSVPLTSVGLPSVTDHILWFARKKQIVKFRDLFVQRETGDKSRYSNVEIADGSRRTLSALERQDPSSLPQGSRPFSIMDLASSGYTPSCTYAFAHNGKKHQTSSGKSWKTTSDGMSVLAKAGRVADSGRTIRYVIFHDDFPITKLANTWMDTTGELDKTYVVQTHTRVVERCLLMASDPGDLVLDPTCGSGTTPVVGELCGRRWIAIDTSRVALALARARIMGARFPFFLLADSADGQRKEAEVTGRAFAEKQTYGNVRHGFVYERAPHITLRSIANNSEISVIWETRQLGIEQQLTNLNRALRGHKVPFPVTTGGREGNGIRFDAAPDATFTMPTGEMVSASAFVEWEVPRQAPADWPEKAIDALAAFWNAKVARQRDIDDSIASKAEFEYLYDRPYEDKRKVRVAGPFTVESLSPHRTLGVGADDELIDPDVARDRGVPSGMSFEQMILDQLKTAGVQQAHKADRITFTSVTAWPGELVCGKGRYYEDGGREAAPSGPREPSGASGAPASDRDGRPRGEAPGSGKEKRAGIFIGPEFGTVGRADLVRAAREAGDAGFDVLIACAFNYEAHAAEFSKLGRIPVLKARMNADLHMAGDLKATSTANLFVIFGEPDIEIHHQSDGRIFVQVKGVDVFDPSTGEVRSDGPDGIACWFIDTDYNEESFFVRHAYFLGQNDPYSALRTTLKAEINAEAWSTLHSDTSRSFEKPKSGRIAVKVINHLGDEVMKVFRVE
jgi:adenine-specific DNA-methyltransferase